MKLRLTLLLILAPALVVAQKSGPGTLGGHLDHRATAVAHRCRRPPRRPPPPAAARGFNNQTVRMMVRTSIGGHACASAWRMPSAAAPVAVGAAHMALRAKDSAIVPGSDRPLTFNGKPC